MSQGEIALFVEIQDDVKRSANLVARMENAFVKVTHDENVEFLYFGNNDTISFKKDNRIKKDFQKSS